MRVQMALKWVQSEPQGCERQNMRVEKLTEKTCTTSSSSDTNRNLSQVWLAEIIGCTNVPMLWNL